MTPRPLPDTPALPEHSTDATGVMTGNDDLGDSCQWSPPVGTPEKAPLPGHEHQLDLRTLTSRAFYAWVAVGWMVLVPLALLRLGGAG